MEFRRNLDSVTFEEAGDVTVDAPFDISEPGRLGDTERPLPPTVAASARVTTCCRSNRTVADECGAGSMSVA